MYCRVCKNKSGGIILFKTQICKECFYEIAAIDIMNEDYDKCINLIKVLLSYYICGNIKLNPVN